MKSYFALLAVSAFLLSGCYTQLQYSRYADNNSDPAGSQIYENESGRSYPFYYKDYETAAWYARHGFGYHSWHDPYHSSLRYGWFGAPGIGFSLRHDWYRDRYFYTPSHAYWNDYIYYDGFVYRRYRFLDDADVDFSQRYAPRSIGTDRLGSAEARPLPVRMGTFGGGTSANEDISNRSRTLGTDREAPSRVRETNSETGRTRSTGRSTVNSGSDNSRSGSSAGPTRSRESDSSSSGTRSRTQ